MFKARLLFLLATLLLSSCAFVPRESYDQVYADDCSMRTRKLTLSVEPIPEGSCPTRDAEACLLTFGVVVPAGTFIVSTSLVIVGNTLHWLEYQGLCEEGVVRKHLIKS